VRKRLGKQVRGLIGRPICQFSIEEKLGKRRMGVAAVPSQNN
jgi:hypothetical protein